LPIVTDQMLQGKYCPVQMSEARLTEWADTVDWPGRNQVGKPGRDLLGNALVDLLGKTVVGQLLQAGG
jgi:hypothetical protein